MNFKLIAFDLDGTLAESKSPVPREIILMLKDLLKKYHVCIISGGAKEQFDKQLFSSDEWRHWFNSKPQKYLAIGQMVLPDPPELHIMPTSGAEYYRYVAGKWSPIYKEVFTEEEAKIIIGYLEWVVCERGLDKLPFKGPQIENRRGQITFSALGQNASTYDKDRWDPKGEERNAIKTLLNNVIPQFEIRVGGSTSIDITRPGVDKGYGMLRLMEHLDLRTEEILFFGDKLNPTGNDYPVLSTGISCVEVKDWKDTLKKIREYY